MTMPPPTRPSTPLRTVITPWTDAFLEGKRQIGDDRADVTVRSVFEGDGQHTVNTLWDGLVNNVQILPSGLPAPVRAYLEETAALPSWANPALIERGSEIFEQYGAQISMALLCGVLPSSYAAAKGVQVLGATRRLEEGVQRRIIETCQFIFDVMAPGGLLRDDGQGIRSAQKIRLVHAAIRHHIGVEVEKGNATWQKAWGVPLNQEDLAGLLMSLSCETIKFLAKLDVEISPEDAEAYLHHWKVVGYLLGIHGDLLPVNMADARALLTTIKLRQAGASEVGTRMTLALVDMMEDLCPGKVYDGVPAAMIRHLIGNTAADLLGLERKHGSQILFRATLKVLDWLDDLSDHDATNELAAEFSRILLQQAPLAPRAANRPAFTLPETLREQWSISEPQSKQWQPDADDREVAAILTREQETLPRRPWLTRQEWRHLCFAHWQLEPEQVQPLLPPGLEIDTYNDKAWISLVAMDLQNAHFHGLPPLPNLPGSLRRLNLSDFSELNLRTYVFRRDDEGTARHGVYFFSIDTSSSAIAWLAKTLFHLPYRAESTSLREHDGTISFTNRRDDQPGAPGTYSCEFQPTGEPLSLAEGSIDHFLADRNLMWTVDGGDLFVGQIHHPPWTIYDAKARFFVNTMPQTIGLVLPEQPDLLRYAPRTDTVLWMIKQDK